MQYSAVDMEGIRPAVSPVVTQGHRPLEAQTTVSASKKGHRAPSLHPPLTGFGMQTHLGPEVNSSVKR